MSEKHILRSYDEGQEKVLHQIYQMSELVEAHLVASLALLTAPDGANAHAIVSSDKVLNDLEVQVSDSIVGLIARHNPMADDLRRLIVAMKVAVMLERMGDYTKNIARRINRHELTNMTETALNTVIGMGELVQTQFKRIMKAYRAEDADAAVKIWHADEAIDNLLDTFYQHVLDEISKKGGKRGTDYLQLLLIAKNIERFGDFVTNIAEEIYYLVYGSLLVDSLKEKPTITRKKNKTSS